MQQQAQVVDRYDQDVQLIVPDVVATIGKAPTSVAEIVAGEGPLFMTPWRRWFGEFAPLATVSGKRDLAICDTESEINDEELDAMVRRCAAASERVLWAAPPHVTERAARLFAALGYQAQDLLRHRLNPSLSPRWRRDLMLFCTERKIVGPPQFAILVPRYKTINHKCHGSILQLLAMTGTAQREISGSAVIDKVRTELASTWLRDPAYAHTTHALWIDTDILWEPQHGIDLLNACREHDWDVCSGVYCTKERYPRIVHKPFDDDEEGLHVGPYAKPHMMAGVGFGFVVTSRRIYDKMLSAWWDSLPTGKIDELHNCWHRDGVFTWDFFRPVLGAPCWDHLDPLTGCLTRAYYNEDYSWCKRVNAAGGECWVQPQLFVEHEGTKAYGPEDVMKVQQ